MKKGAGRLEIILSIRLPVREIQTFVRGRSSAGVFSGTWTPPRWFRDAKSLRAALNNGLVALTKCHKRTLSAQILTPKIFIRGVGGAK